MLDEICPVQFVDGLNEGAEPSGGDSIVITKYSGTGIQYIPKVSYSLTKLEMMMTFGYLPQEAQIKVNLCSDYDERPSDIILSSGSFVPKSVYAGWYEVTLKPVSVIKNKKYWITVHPNGCPTGLIRAGKGESCLLSVMTDNRWAAPPEDIKDGKVMFKLYGRIFPVSTS